MHSTNQLSNLFNVQVCFTACGQHATVLISRSACKSSGSTEVYSAKERMALQRREYSTVHCTGCLYCMASSTGPLAGTRLLSQVQRLGDGLAYSCHRSSLVNQGIDDLVRPYAAEAVQYSAPQVMSSTHVSSTDR